MTAWVLTSVMPEETNSQDYLEGLLVAARGGDASALDRFLSRIEKRVYVFAYRLTGDVAAAEDASQDALFGICRNLSKYRSGTNLWGWIYRIVLNRTRDHLRAKRLHASIDDVPLHAGHEDFEQRQRMDRVVAALELLTEKERAAVVLMDMEGMTCREAASVMGCLQIAARTRATQGRKRLRAALSSYYPELLEKK